MFVERCGNDKLDNLFVMRDTLLSYCTERNLTPLYFRKGALEGKRYYVDELWYSYPQNNSKVKMHRIDADGKQHWLEEEYTDCIYDMMSIFLRTRNFDATNLKKNDLNHIPVRLDLNLSFGSAKVFLKGYQGVRSPMTSEIK